MNKKKAIRVEQLMVERGLAPSIERARALIMAGEVSVDTVRIQSGAQQIDEQSAIVVAGVQPFVSRGGFKLDRALDSFSITVEGRVCADIGAATGGFSDVMLQRAAAKVYAVDVGYGDLHWKVRSDSRVVPIERTNARYLESLPEAVSLIAVDVSFISIAHLWHNLHRWLDAQGDLIVLLKPQFEAEQDEVSKGEGIITDSHIHRRVLQSAVESATKDGFTVCDVIQSPIVGVHGNVEFLMHLRKASDRPERNVDQLIERAGL